MKLEWALLFTEMMLTPTLDCSACSSDDVGTGNGNNTATPTAYADIPSADGLRGLKETSIKSRSGSSGM